MDATVSRCHMWKKGLFAILVPLSLDVMALQNPFLNKHSDNSNAFFRKNPTFNREEFF